MSGKKHILFISSWYPTKYNPTHGIFNHYFAEAVALNNNVSVLHVMSEERLTSSIESEQKELNGMLILTVSYKKITTNLPFISKFKKRNGLLKAFEFGYEKIVEAKGKPDIIHLNVIYPAGIGVFHLSKKFKLPYVINENWSGYCKEDGNYKGFFLKAITQSVVARAKALLPTSKFLEEAMLSHNLHGNYQVVPNVVNVNRFVPAYKSSIKKTRLLHISSLTDREKNVTGIVTAFCKALDKNPELELYIVGEGPEKSKFESLALKLDKKGKIKFLGRLTGKQLVDEINAADALIMFSYFETFCLVIAEAFACGKPVITSDAGAIKSYMKPELGIMVKSDNVNELVDAILRFAETKTEYNSELIRNYAVENFSYEKVSLQLDKIYNEALNSKFKS
jgi:glycosyltransferase involved in cell wall biosynthesis